MSDDQYREMKTLQTTAFSTMLTLVDSLNSFADGKYLFGGGISTNPPIDFPFSTLEEFQKYYDGINITYPTSSSANLSSYSVNGSQIGDIQLIGDGTNQGVIKINNDTGTFLKSSFTASEGTSGNLTFDSDKNQIKATQYGTFATYQPGDTLVISDAGDGLNGAYIVKSGSADGKTITFEDSTQTQTDAVLENGQNAEGGSAKFSTSFPVGSVIDMSGFDSNVSPNVQFTGFSADGIDLMSVV